MWFYLSSSSWDIVTQTIAITSEVPQGILIIACTLPTFGCCRLLFGVVFLVDSGCELVVESLQSSPPAHCLSRYRNFHPGSIFHWIFDSAMRKDCNDRISMLFSWVLEFNCFACFDSLSTRLTRLAPIFRFRLHSPRSNR